MSLDPSKQNRDIKSLQPIAQKAAKLFLDTCAKRGVKIFVTEYHRSQTRQNWLYEQGRSRPGQVVTWTKNSNHTSGFAWDIACNPPQALYDDKVIAKAGAIAKELGITWGGEWKQKDTPHFEIKSTWKEPATTPPTQNTLKEIDVKLSIDGVAKTVKAFNIEGYNFIKLRDIESSNIKIGYNSMATVTSMSKNLNMDYKPVKTPTIKGAEQGKININGEVVTVNLVMSKDYNYIRMQDLNSKYIKIEYDNVAKLPKIITK